MLVSVREVLACANEQREFFREYVLKKGEQEQKEAIRQQQRELDKAQRRMSELNILFQKLFEGNTMGHISNERFRSLSQGYEEEQKTLKVKISVLTSEVQISNEKATNIERFLKVAEKYTDLQELPPTILRELIDKVLVYEPIHLNGKKRQQKIQACYNFIGNIDLQKEPPGEFITPRGVRLDVTVLCDTCPFANPFFAKALNKGCSNRAASFLLTLYKLLPKKLNNNSKLNHFYDYHRIRAV